LLAGAAGPTLAQAPDDTSSEPRPVLPVGTWTGTITAPEGTPTFDARYHVRMRGDEIRISVRTDAFELGFSDVRVEGDRLLFSFTDAPVVRCTVTLAEDGSYRGGCVDAGGDAEVVVMIPPAQSAPDLPDTLPSRRHILGLMGMSGEVETPTGILRAPYSRAVQVGPTLYLSGHGTGRYVGPEGTTEVEAAEHEARRVLEGMKASLDLADMTMADLVARTCYGPRLRPPAEGCEGSPSPQPRGLREVLVPADHQERV
jgi:enamine deaminase RidA (YjgF/YER057c/UK114 family)